MTETKQQQQSTAEIRFTRRGCGHRVPYGQKRCPYCDPPRMPAEPLRELLISRAARIGFERMTLDVATRLGMTYERIEQKLRRITNGKVASISMRTADELCTALESDSAATLYGYLWENASPVEPYGDEDFG